MYAAIKLKMRSTGGGVLTVNWAGQKKGGGEQSGSDSVQQSKIWPFRGVEGIGTQHLRFFEQIYKRNFMS